MTVAFKRLDRNGNGDIELDDIKGSYNASQHPDVKMGKKTQDEVLYDFLDTFEQHYALANPGSRDKKVSLKEFVEYYNNISVSIDNDDYFELMIKNAWNLDNRTAQKAWAGEY